MKKIVRLLPLFVFVMFVGMVILLDSCGKKSNQAPQTIDQKVDSAMKQQAAPSAAGDTSKAAVSPAITLNDKAKKGQAIFYNTSLGKVSASCAMCHADGTAKTKDGHTRAGHTLAGVASRTATWNGMFKSADLKKSAYGATFCISGFQKRNGGDIAKALSVDEADALDEYLSAITDAPGAIKKNLTIQWILKPEFGDDAQLDDKLTTPAVKAIMKLPGDPGKGQAVFQGTCASCHSIGQKKVGPSMKDAAQDMSFVAQSIRCGSNGMPFFAKDILSDQQIADVVAYIQSSVK